MVDVVVEAFEGSASHHHRVLKTNFVLIKYFIFIWAVSYTMYSL